MPVDITNHGHAYEQWVTAAVIVELQNMVKPQIKSGSPISSSFKCQVTVTSTAVMVAVSCFGKVKCLVSVTPSTTARAKTSGCFDQYETPTSTIK
jgi:hypothetical protein